MVGDFWAQNFPGKPEALEPEPPAPVGNENYETRGPHGDEVETR